MVAGSLPLGFFNQKLTIRLILVFATTAKTIRCLIISFETLWSIKFCYHRKGH
jgi:hypothetical protein